MSNRPPKKQTGRVEYVWVLAGGYLIYLSYSILKTFLAGETSSPVASVIGGLVFLAVGCWLCYREWKAYKYGAEHMDDPDTWNDGEPEESEVLAVDETTEAPVESRDEE